MAIDDVIARARQPGGYSERREFSVARERAIRKMREFALADPHYYILELFQAAVANRASHVDIQISQTSLSFSYVGGGYAREELAQIFDYLFASKEDVAHGDIRQLAVGINALMITEPDRIIIESGDGTRNATHRITIRGDADTVEVGTPAKALDGTYVRAEGIDRSAIADRSTLSPMNYGPPECRAIENRCLAAPIPIIVNGNALFGYSSTRTPVLYGYDNVVTFDEGDLYGSIGIPQKRHKRSVRLLTWGCWIESTGHADMEGTPVGGIVAYDRLNKTADHSGIVQDHRFEELWARIRPYARQVTSGEAGASGYSVSTLDGDVINPGELRQFLRDHRVVVAVPYALGGGSTDERTTRARDIGDALDAPVLRVPSDARNAIRMLSGPDADVLEPPLDDQTTHSRDLAIYRQPTRQPPPRPWVTGAVELDPVEVEQLAERVATEELALDTGDSPQKDSDTDSALLDDIKRRLGHRGSIQSRIYTPVDPPGAGELTVRIISVDRVVWQGSVSSPYPGHQLDIELPATAPGNLNDTNLSPSDGADADVEFGRRVARVFARRSVDALKRATTRALRTLSTGDITPDSTAARLVLAELARSSIKRLRSIESDDTPRHTITFDLVDDAADIDLLAAPVFRTLSGDLVGLREIVDWMSHTEGLVYGTVPEVTPDLTGLDQTRILELDLEREELLISIVGEAAYVRIDQRDILARLDTDDGRELCVRDLAVGLREYPDGDLLIESPNDENKATLQSDALDSKRTATLVRQLIDIWDGEDEDPQDRRQAVRHLQRFAARRHRRSKSASSDEHASDGPDDLTRLVHRLPLFLDADRQPCSFYQVLAGLESEDGVVMVDGRSSDVCALGTLADQPVKELAREEHPVHELMMNSWAHHLLSPIGKLTGAFDFDFSTATGSPNASTHDSPEDASLLASQPIDGSGFSGIIGVPEEAVARPSVAVIDHENRRSRQLRDTARTFGVVGYIDIDAGSIDSLQRSITRSVDRAARDCLTELLQRLPSLDPASADDPPGPAAARTFDVLYTFASRHLRFIRHPSGTVSPRIDDSLAQQIFEIPLFPTSFGVPVSATRLIHDYAVEAATAPDADVTDRISLGEIPEMLQRWMTDHLAPSNIIEPARHDDRNADSDPTPHSKQGEKQATDQSSRNPARQLLTALRRATADSEVEPVFDRHLIVAIGSEQHLPDIATDQSLLNVLRPMFSRGEPFRALPIDDLGVSSLRDSPLPVAAFGDQPTCLLFGNADHSLLQKLADESATDANGPFSEATAWCALAAFPPLAERIDRLTDDQHMRFQRHIMRALAPEPK